MADWWLQGGTCSIDNPNTCNPGYYCEIRKDNNDNVLFATCQRDHCANMNCPRCCMNYTHEGRCEECPEDCSAAATRNWNCSEVEKDCPDNVGPNGRIFKWWQRDRCNCSVSFGTYFCGNMTVSCCKLKEKFCPPKGGDPSGAPDGQPDGQPSGQPDDSPADPDGDPSAQPDASPADPSGDPSDPSTPDGDVSDPDYDSDDPDATPSGPSYPVPGAGDPASPSGDDPSTPGGSDPSSSDPDGGSSPDSPGPGERNPDEDPSPGIVFDDADVGGPGAENIKRIPTLKE